MSDADPNQHFENIPNENPTTSDVTFISVPNDNQIEIEHQVVPGIQRNRNETDGTGDDISKINDLNISCECSLNTDGAAAAVSILQTEQSESSSQNSATKFKTNSNSEDRGSRTACKRSSMIPVLSRPTPVNRNPVPVKNVGNDVKPAARRQQPVTKVSKPIQKPKKSDTRQSNKSSSRSVANKMSSVEKELKATTTIINKKLGISPQKASDKVKPTICSTSQENENNVLGLLYKNISQIKNTTSVLSNTTNFKDQKVCIENLYRNISEIQKIADKLTEVEDVNSEDVNSENKRVTKPKNEDKKVVILAESVDAPQGCESFPESSKINTEEILPFQKPETDSTNKEQTLNPSDSMDGIFIPSSSPPVNIYDEEENEIENGQPIAEIKNLFGVTNESGLSLRFSNLSIEAVKTLKKCPKELTLCMDIIQGRFLFQPRKVPPQSSYISSDSLEDVVTEERKSDLILKASTDRVFISEIIPVENGGPPIDDLSYKSIELRNVKSTIFSVINIPAMFKNNSLSIVTKSCITLQEGGFLPTITTIAEHGMSMPEITGIPTVIDDKSLPEVKDKEKESELNTR